MTPDKITRRPGSSRHQRTTAVLAAISIYTVATAGVLWLFDGLPTAVRLPLALPVLLLFPGYAVLNALLPGFGRPTNDLRTDDSPPEDRSPGDYSTLERGILAIVTSIAVVPMVALATAPVAGVDGDVILAGVAGVTVVASGISVLRSPAVETREARRAERQRFRGRAILEAGRKHVLTDTVSQVAIAITVLLLVASAGVAFTGSTDDAPMTEFYVVDETGDAGDVGTTSPDGTVFDLRIKHHSDEPRPYTVVVMGLDDASGADAGSWTELHRASLEVAPDETAGETYRATGSELNGTSTVQFLLYTGDAPADADPETAHRTLEISVDETTE